MYNCQSRRWGEFLYQILASAIYQRSSLDLVTQVRCSVIRELPIYRTMSQRRYNVERSCLRCHAHKIKCDKNSPCSKCSRSSVPWSSPQLTVQDAPTVPQHRLCSSLGIGAKYSFTWPICCTRSPYPPRVSRQRRPVYQ
jgi:hypothetical protein